MVVSCPGALPLARFEGSTDRVPRPLPAQLPSERVVIAASPRHGVVPFRQRVSRRRRSKPRPASAVPNSVSDAGSGIPRHGGGQDRWQRLQAKMVSKRRGEILGLASFGNAYHVHRCRWEEQWTLAIRGQSNG